MPGLGNLAFQGLGRAAVGFRVSGLGFRVLGFRVSGLGFRLALGSKCGVQAPWIRKGRFTAGMACSLKGPWDLASGAIVR